MSGKFARTGTGLRRLSLSRRLPVPYRRGSPACRCSAAQWWLMNIRSMRHRACMRHLLCMLTPVRVGVTDGAIDATSEAVGKSGIL